MSLEGVVRARAGEREAQFMRLRERIEACAAGKYQVTEFEGTPPGIILRSPAAPVAPSTVTSLGPNGAARVGFRQLLQRGEPARD
jgi:hypothetical protein